MKIFIIALIGIVIFSSMLSIINTIQPLKGGITNDPSFDDF